LLANDRSRAVKFEIAGGKVEISSSSPELGDAHEQVAVDYSGPALQICVNEKYVSEFLNVVQTDGIELNLKDEVSQAVMRPVAADRDGYTHLLLTQPSS